MKRVVLLLLMILALVACGHPRFGNVPDPLTPAELAELERENAQVVRSAALACEQEEHIYPLGAHSWDLAADFAEEASEITILIVDLCMFESIVIAQAVAACDLTPHVIQGAFGTYGYREEFVRSKNDAEMIRLDRCVIEQSNRIGAGVS